MHDFLDLMLKPFLTCLILTGIHAYLGSHVIQRGVIFVDLALAQVAAFGSTVGLLWGWGLHSTPGYFCALACTMIGAAVLALTRMRKPVVPQEALIGIVYVMAAAGAIMVLSRTPEGGEELKSLLVGHILFVDWHEIIKILAIYLAIGSIHWAARSKFFLISADPEHALNQGLNVRAWDFLFYATFGFVVTSSTELAGVLLVFSFLIVPAVCAAYLASAVRARLIIGWASGALTSIIGISASYAFDFPTGATVVCAFGVCLMACFILRAAKTSGRSRKIPRAALLVLGFLLTFPPPTTACFINSGTGTSIIQSSGSAAACRRHLPRHGRSSMSRERIRV